MISNIITSPKTRLLTITDGLTDASKTINRKKKAGYDPIVYYSFLLREKEMSENTIVAKNKYKDIYNKILKKNMYNIPVIEKTDEEKQMLTIPLMMAEKADSDMF